MTYKVAFAQQSDPYTWMLRGLMDMGWEDISLSPESYPQIKGRGIDYSGLINPMSRFGLRLVTLALDENNEWYRSAGSYEFEARLVNDPRLSYSILLRSDEMAFSQLFQWNANHPMYVIEDLHKAIVEATIQFIAKNKRRENISSIDLQEMLNHPIIHPPPTFTNFMTPRIQRGVSLNTAQQEGLWQNEHPQPRVAQHPPPLPTPSFNSPTAATSSSPPSFSTGSQSLEGSSNSQWTIQAGQGRGQLMGQTGLASQQHSSAMVLVEPAIKWLRWTAYIGILMGILALVNSMFTLFMVSSGAVVRGSKDGLYIMVVIASSVLGLLGSVGGFLAHRHIEDFQTLSKRTMRMFPVLFALGYPLSWFIGLPTGIFALYLLRNPVVRDELRGR